MSTGVAKAGRGGSPEVPRKFVPTPERLSQYLERKAEVVNTQLTSVEGRKLISAELLKHEADIKKMDPSFDPKQLDHQLELVGETLRQKQRFMTDVKSPEKKGFFKRAWEGVKGFAKKHPIVTTLLVLAAATAAVGGAAYLVGGWEALLAKVGMGHLYGPAGASGAAEAVGNVINGTKELPNTFLGPTGPAMP